MIAKRGNETDKGRVAKGFFFLSERNNWRHIPREHLDPQGNGMEDELAMSGEQGNLVTFKYVFGGAEGTAEF